MKINYALWKTTCSGGTRIIYKIINGLIDKGHDVTISAVCGDHSWFPLKAEVKYIPNNKFNGRYSSVLGIPKLYKLIKKQDVDINMVTTCLIAYPVAKCGQGEKFYFMQHYEPYFLKNPVWKYLAKKSYSLDFNMIASSSWLKKEFETKTGKIPKVINPGIDLEEFRPKKTIKDTSKKRILCLGKKLRWKGNVEMFEAFRLMLKKRKDIELIIYGANPGIKTNVPYTFKGHLIKEELINLYNSCDVVVLPSWYESFPRPPLEGMACGIPVVTTCYGTEDFAFDNINSLVVEPRKPQLIANAVLKILDNEDLAKRLISGGFKTVKEFTWEKTVNKFDSLFKKWYH